MPRLEIEQQNALGRQFQLDTDTRRPRRQMPSAAEVRFWGMPEPDREAPGAGGQLQLHLLHQPAVGRTIETPHTPPVAAEGMAPLQGLPPAAALNRPEPQSRAGRHLFSRRIPLSRWHGPNTAEQPSGRSSSSRKAADMSLRCWLTPSQPAAREYRDK